MQRPNLPIKRFLMMTLVVVSMIKADAQKAGAVFSKKPFNHYAIESSVSVVPLDDYTNSNGLTSFYLEYILNLNVMTNLSAHWQFVLHFNQIWGQFGKKIIDNYYLAGVMGRYNFGMNPKLVFFLEPGINLGNYCTCLTNVSNRNELPFKREGMIYASLGAGALIKINKIAWLKLGFYVYDWVNVSKDISFGGFNIPTVGISFNFGQK